MYKTYLDVFSNCIVQVLYMYSYTYFCTYLYVCRMYFRTYFVCICVRILYVFIYVSCVYFYTLLYVFFYVFLYKACMYFSTYFIRFSHVSCYVWLDCWYSFLVVILWYYVDCGPLFKWDSLVTRHWRWTPPSFRWWCSYLKRACVGLGFCATECLCLALVSISCLIRLIC